MMGGLESGDGEGWRWLPGSKIVSVKRLQGSIYEGMGGRMWWERRLLVLRVCVGTRFVRLFTHVHIRRLGFTYYVVSEDLYQLNCVTVSIQ